MRVVKLAIISFVVFFVVLLLITLLIPSEVRISRAINIYATKESIHPYIGDLQKWPMWNEMANDSIRVTVTESSLPHVVTRWAHGDKQLTSSFRLEESAKITVVQWYFDFKLKWYPWEKLGSIVLDKQFGPAMERSLGTLKNLVEKTP